eukprot:TRINITY_DN1212_c0_g1_i3.p1 TRINITY_DN1212_c0_g1~~TRINITY_DN1212_c0_g1_i3.p1  ORF type:complete len:755 (+),score=195.01 TRINITY_DN1212_c0_g1_i3:48-2267(+)
MCIRDSINAEYMGSKIMKKIFLILLAIQAFANGQQCRKFECAEGGIVDPNDTTICYQKQNSGIIKIGDCPRGMYCDMNDLESKTIHCRKKLNIRKLAGEKFEDSPTECFTAKADENGYCVGRKYGETCATNGDADCDVDLYCGERKYCERAKLEGEFCNRREKCASYLLCAFEDGVDSKCRPYAYHKNGDSVGPGEEEEICEERYYNKDFVCEHGPFLVSPNLKDKPGEKCVYSHGEDDKSRCFYHFQGYAICRKGSGDQLAEWKLVLDYLKRRPKCHVSFLMAQCDKGREVMPNDESWAEVWRAIGKLDWEDQIEGLLDCMKQYVHPNLFRYDRKSLWSKPVKIANGVKGPSLYIDNSTNLIHTAFCERYKDTDQYYLILQTMSLNGTFIEKRALDKIHGCLETNIAGENDGKKIFIAFSGARMADNNECSKKGTKGCIDVYTKESSDGGITWTPSTPVPRNDLDDIARRYNIRLIYMAEVKRTWLFFAKDIYGANYSTAWYTMKSPGSIVYNNEQLLMPGDKQNFSLAYTTTLRGSTILHAVWTEYSESKYLTYYSQTQNNGMNWQTPILFFQNKIKSPLVKLVADPMRKPGYIFIFFPESSENNWKVIWSPDHGDNWSTDKAIFPLSLNFGVAMCTLSETIHTSLVFALGLNHTTSRFGSFVLEENKFKNIEAPFTKIEKKDGLSIACIPLPSIKKMEVKALTIGEGTKSELYYSCLLYTSPSPRDLSTSRMPSSA